MIITNINTFVAFSCLLMGMTDLYDKEITLIERLDTTSYLKEKNTLLQNSIFISCVEMCVLVSQIPGRQNSSMLFSFLVSASCRSS